MKFTLTLFVFFIFSNNSHAAWTCWAKPGEKPTAMTMDDSCGKKFAHARLVCRQNVFCSDVTQETRAKIDKAWSDVENMAAGAQEAFGNMPPDVALYIIQNNPYANMAIQHLNETRNNAATNEQKLLNENRIDAEVSCPGTLAQDGAAECPPPDKCIGAKVVTMKIATTVKGGFTKEAKSLAPGGTFK